MWHAAPELVARGPEGGVEVGFLKGHGLNAQPLGCLAYELDRRNPVNFRENLGDLR